LIHWHTRQTSHLASSHQSGLNIQKSKTVKIELEKMKEGEVAAIH
jgi:hypothetical protein